MGNQATGPEGVMIKTQQPRYKFWMRLFSFLLIFVFVCQTAHIEYVFAQDEGDGEGGYEGDDGGGYEGDGEGDFRGDDGGGGDFGDGEGDFSDDPGGGEDFSDWEDGTGDFSDDLGGGADFGDENLFVDDNFDTNDNDFIFAQNDETENIDVDNAVQYGALPPEDSDTAEYLVFDEGAENDAVAEETDTEVAVDETPADITDEDLADIANTGDEEVANNDVPAMDSEDNTQVAVDETENIDVDNAVQYGALPPEDSDTAEYLVFDEGAENDAVAEETDTEVAVDETPADITDEDLADIANTGDEEVANNDVPAMDSEDNTQVAVDETENIDVDNAVQYGALPPEDSDTAEYLVFDEGAENDAVAEETDTEVAVDETPADITDEDLADIANTGDEEVANNDVPAMDSEDNTQVAVDETPADITDEDLADIANTGDEEVANNDVPAMDSEDNTQVAVDETENIDVDNAVQYGALPPEDSDTAEYLVFDEGAENDAVAEETDTEVAVDETPADITDEDLADIANTGDEEVANNDVPAMDSEDNTQVAVDETPADITDEDLADIANTGDEEVANNDVPAMDSEDNTQVAVDETENIDVDNAVQYGALPPEDSDTAEYLVFDEGAENDAVAEETDTEVAVDETPADITDEDLADIANTGDEEVANNDVPAMDSEDNTQVAVDETENIDVDNAVQYGALPPEDSDTAEYLVFDEARDNAIENTLGVAGNNGATGNEGGIGTEDVASEEGAAPVMDSQDTVQTKAQKIWQQAVEHYGSVQAAKDAAMEKLPAQESFANSELNNRDDGSLNQEILGIASRVISNPEDPTGAAGPVGAIGLTGPVLGGVSMDMKVDESSFEQASPEQTKEMEGIVKSAREAFKKNPGAVAVTLDSSKPTSGEEAPTKYNATTDEITSTIGAKADDSTGEVRTAATTPAQAGAPKEGTLAVASLLGALKSAVIGASANKPAPLTVDRSDPLTLSNDVNKPDPRLGAGPARPQTVGPALPGRPQQQAGQMALTQSMSPEEKKFFVQQFGSHLGGMKGSPVSREMQAKIAQENALKDVMNARARGAFMQGGAPNLGGIQQGQFGGQMPFGNQQQGAQGYAPFMGMASGAGMNPANSARESGRIRAHEMAAAAAQTPGQRTQAILASTEHQARLADRMYTAQQKQATQTPQPNLQGITPGAGNIPQLANTPVQPTPQPDPIAAKNSKYSKFVSDGVMNNIRNNTSEKIDTEQVRAQINQKVDKLVSEGKINSDQRNQVIEDTAKIVSNRIETVKVGAPARQLARNEAAQHEANLRIPPVDIDAAISANKMRLTGKAWKEHYNAGIPGSSNYNRNIKQVQNDIDLDMAVINTAKGVDNPGDPYYEVNKMVSRMDTQGKENYRQILGSRVTQMPTEVQTKVLVPTMKPANKANLKPAPVINRGNIASDNTLPVDWNS